MSGSEKLKSALDDASSIKAFLSKIGITGTPSTQLEDVAKKVGELNVSDENTKDNSAVASAIPSTAVSNFASPESKASDSVTPEKVSDWFAENAPPDHFRSKNPLVGSVRAQEVQGSPQGSPQAAGVVAPPPTPETISSLAIGKMIHDELDRIPEERFMTLGDSKFAPKNQSRLSNIARPLAPSEQFFSAVPRSSKPRDDPGFTRMSFKAADAPTVPSFITDSKPNANPTANKPFLVQGPPSAPQQKKENARPISSKDGWSQTNNSNGPPKVLAPDTPDSPYVNPHLRGVKGIKASKVFTPDTPDTPPAAPHLKPKRIEEVTASQVFTPDTPDDQLEVQEEQVLRGGDARPRLQEVKAHQNPFSTTSVPHPLKADKGEATKAPVAKPVINIKTANLAPDDSSDVSAGALTPSSMTFTAVSPSKVRAAGITTATGPAKIVGDNLEGALYFKAWPTQPKSEERSSRTGKSSPFAFDTMP